MQRSLLLLWWRNFQLEDWRNFQLVSTGVHTYTAVLTSDSIGLSNIIDDKISMLYPSGYSVTSGNKRIYISLQQNQNGSYIADLYSNAWPTKDSVTTGSVYIDQENDGTLKVK